MVLYLLWKVMTNDITLSFMIPWHTKFSQDWCYGLLKKYVRTKVGGLSDLCGVVNNNSATVNVAQPAGLEDGSVVPTYDWRLAVLFPVLHEGEGHQEAAPHLVIIQLAWLHLYKGGESTEKICILKDKNWKPKKDELPRPLTYKSLSTAAVVSV